MKLYLLKPPCFPNYQYYDKTRKKGLVEILMANGKKTKIIACRMMYDELNLAMVRSGCDYPVEWVEEGLHNSIDKLRQRLQEELDNTKDIDTVLLAFGFCGYAVDGLRAGDFELVIPKVDDCISLLLFPFKEGKEPGRYYVTRAWLDSEKNMWNEYQSVVKRYGEKKAKRVFEVMYAGYKDFSLIDTGAYNLDKAKEKSMTLARQLGLTHHVESGSVNWLNLLLTGPWDERFCVFSPWETVSLGFDAAKIN